MKEDEHNLRAFAAYREGASKKPQQLFCILSIDNTGVTQVFQSTLYNPKELADLLVKTGIQIQDNLHKKES